MIEKSIEQHTGEQSQRASGSLSQPAVRASTGKLCFIWNV